MDKETQEKFFEGTNNLITSIAQQVSNTIPDTWEKFYFHADINDDFSGRVYFFFNTEKNKKLTYYGEILELKKIRNYWICYGKISNNNKIYFIINQKNEIEVLGTTEEELNRKIKKKINFHDPRFYMVRFGGIMVED